MKYLYSFLSILALFISGNAYASTLSGDLLEIQGKIGTGYYLDYYDLSTLDGDINKQITIDEWPEAENNVQISSKMPGWNKEEFLNFTQALKNKNTKGAISILKKNKLVDPFVGIGNAGGGIIGYKSTANGFITVGFGTQGYGIWYNMDYYFFRNNVIYSISKSLPFKDRMKRNTNITDIFEYCKNESDASCIPIKTSTTSQEVGISELKGYLANPNKNNNFKKFYNQFISDMSKIWR